MNPSLTAKNNPINYISLGLLAMMFTLPFLINRHIPPIPSFWGEALAFGLGLAASLALMARAVWQPLHFPAIALVPLGLIMVVLAQVVTGLSAYPHHHLLVALYLLWAALLMLLGANLKRFINITEITQVLAITLLAGGVLCSALVFLQMAQSNPFGWVMPRVKGYHANIGQVNHLADYLALGLAGSLYLFAQRRLKIGWFAPSVIGMLAALSMTGSRSSWIYLILLIALAWVSKKNSPNESTSRLFRAALSLIPIFVLVQLLLPLLPVQKLMTPAQMVLEKAAGPSIRMELLRESWTIFLSNPWLGAGWGQFSWQQFLLAWPNTPANYLGTVEHTHNILLQLLAETGLSGTLVLVAGASYWLWAGRKTAINLERWWLLASVGILATHSMLEYPLWYANFLGLLAILLGLGEQRQLPSKLGTGRLLLVLILTLGSGLLGKTLIEYSTMEQWLLETVHRKPSDEDLKKTHGELLGLSQGSLLSPYALAVVERTLKADPQKIEQRLALNLAVLRYKPNAEAAYKRALLLAIAGRKNEAVLQMRRAFHAFPLRASKQNQLALEIFQLARNGQVEVVPLLLELQRNKPLPDRKVKRSQ